MMRATRKELGQEKKSKLEGEQEDERGVKKKKKVKRTRSPPQRQSHRGTPRSHQSPR